MKRFGLNYRLFIGTFGLLISFLSQSNGQIYSFINYGIERDIPNGFVYNIKQSADGFLWIGTANGIIRFDGYKFFPVEYPDSITNRYPTKSIKDKNGTLWFGCSDGSLFHSNGNKLIKVPVSNSRSISEIIEGPDDRIYLIPQGRCIFSVNAVNTNEIHQYFSSIEPVILSSAFSNSGDLLLGTEENLQICKISGDSVKVLKIIDEFDSFGVTSIEKMSKDSKFLLGTNGNGLFQLSLTDKIRNLSHFPDNPELDAIKVQAITEDTNGSFWISTSGSGALQLNLSDDFKSVKSIKKFDMNSGLIGNNINTVFQDIEGSFWFGLYGEGLSLLTSYALSFYSPGKDPQGNNILYIKNIDNNYLLGTPTGFHIFDAESGRSLSFTDLTYQTGHTEIKSFYLDSAENLFIGTGGNGLFIRNFNGSVHRFFRSGDSGADDIKDIEMDKKNIWLATTNGVIVLNRTGKLVKKIDINNGLPHNSINKIYLNHHGAAYIGTESDRVFRIDSSFNIIQGNASMAGSTRNKVLSYTESDDGSIWAATYGNGVFRFLNDSATVLSKSNDLMSNYCYSILADDQNNIWVGHNKGISRINTVTGTVRIFGTDFAKAGICNSDGMFKSNDKKMLIGTTEGLLIFDLAKDIKSEIAPFSNINTIEINDVPFPYQQSFVLPYMKYKIKVYYSGINFCNPEKVYYSTYMENFDLDWSKMTTSREELYNLREGKFKFNLISVNQEGLSQGNPVSFTILIKKPFYRTWWFILTAILSLAAVVVLIIRERDKSQKKIQDYLEKELDARTSVVMKQKGEIELQNIEITDSINYAKRIQTSILPDINKVKETFKDAFILFHPRDIVSGDFYWFDRLDEDKFVLVCADSTGHGVPGAFMSMIGSTLLQDIVTRKRISKPSEILTLLDKQIFSTLNQNVELGVSNDGMDMVVCEFNLSTRHLRFASAMRPVILVLDGESFYIKGNRSSVGGESVIEKFFDDQEYYLKEGDTVYLFSDGLPDQFGGVDGKKMKIARLKKMIEQIAGLPMDEQKRAMSKFYFDWKGSYEQVDDVLLIGVKV